MKDQCAVNVERLTVHYDNVPALWEVNFDVPPGKLVGIIGPNGAGKSTLLKTLLGVLKPISGEISFFGQTLKQMQGRTAYVPQRTSVDWDFPICVLDVVLMGLYGKLGILKWASKSDRKAAEKALEKIGMLSFAKRQISELSGGQQQRVFLARALLQEADIYFMDEPFAGIDISTEKALVELLFILKEEGKTLFIVHHDLTTVRSYFDWVILMNTCLIASGPVEEVFTEENLEKTYGKSAYMIVRAKKLAQKQSKGG
ncbi:MAG: High-affinity zinc uptake system ATP-binding protein ZnuC [Chlamydiae bacterium]|nr:High-affinity zinc uptake system ATP-binding protein ZnuC [Chlamydiota bacterium]